MPAAGGLQLLVVERAVAAEDLKELIPQGTRSVSIFLVNHRPPLDDERDHNFAFQAELAACGIRMLGD